jgi:hypothetical protein
MLDLETLGRFYEEGVEDHPGGVEVGARLDLWRPPRHYYLVRFAGTGRGAAGSDIDILIVLKGRVDPATEIARLGPITAALSLTNDVVISCVFISAERFATEQSPLLINVRREGVTILTTGFPTSGRTAARQATAFRTRNSTLCPVAERTRIRRSVEIP